MWNRLIAGLCRSADSHPALMKAVRRAVVGLRRLADRLELHQVQAALDAGYGWTEIAAALGVTRQAVHKKYHRRVRVERGRP